MLRITRQAVITVLSAHLAAGVAGVLTGLSLSRDMPGIENLNLMNLPQRTVLVDRQGEMLHAFAEQRRIPVVLDQMSPWYSKAIVAIEDPRFYRHIGVDPIAVGRAALNTVRAMDFGVEGASTITMQLARLQFLHPKKTLSRKIQEALLATQIERSYSKEEILTFYANRIYLGHGNYGVEAASRFYFGKPSLELTLPEAALLAGLTQIPERLTPVRYPDRALRRRNHVLARMIAEGLLDEATGREAMETPVALHDGSPQQALGQYFVEEVRRLVARRFGEAALYREGLVVQTTLDRRLQQAAERAVAWGLDEYGRRHQQLPPPEPLPDGEAPDEYDDPRWRAVLRVDDIVPAVVEEAGAAKATIRIGETRLVLGRSAIDWTGKRALDAVLQPATLVPVRIVKVDQNDRPQEASLASAPVAEAALIAMDAATGEILALVGGKDFSKSEFDRAMQARRQAGSAFKPLIYAAALELGFQPTHVLYDAPLVLVDPGVEAPYQPENFERDYEGYVTIRHALEHSRNIPTVRLLDAIGYRPAVDIARRLGIATELRPYPSLALGAFEVRLSSLVAAYAAFVNGGVLVTPSLMRAVRHSERQELWEPPTEAEEVLAPEVAGMVASLLEGAVLHGTGVAAQAVGRPVAGKTGTTDDYTDAWFIGFTPSIAVGVWVGNDKKETLGRLETGARAALPIWIRFLQDGLADEPVEEFLRPPGMQRTLIDGTTGKLARREIGCRRVLLESIPAAREAPPPCGWRDHRRHDLPYPLQPYPIDERGALLLRPRDAARLVARAPDRFRLIGGGRYLSYQWGERSGSVPLGWSQEDWFAYLAELPLAATRDRLVRQERAEFVAEFQTPPGEDASESLRDALPAHLREGRDGWPAELLEVNRSGQARSPAEPFDP